MAVQRRAVIYVLAFAGVSMAAVALYSRYRSSVQQQAEATAEIDKLGGSVKHDKEFGLQVDLCINTITDEDLAHLQGLSGIRLLDLRFSQVSDLGLSRLSNLTSITNLNLDHTQIDGSGLVHLQRLARLEGLNLAYTAVDDEGIKSLRGLTSLRRLNLNHTKVTDAGLDYLSGLRGLECLIVTGTGVTPGGCSSLQKHLPRASLHQEVDGMPGFELMMPGQPAWAMTTGRKSLRSAEQLALPVTIVQRVPFADGGTCGTVLRDSNGDEFAFCRTPHDPFPGTYLPNRLYIGGIHPTAPGARLVPIGSREERLLEGAFDKALNQRTAH